MARNGGVALARARSQARPCRTSEQLAKAEAMLARRYRRLAHSVPGRVAARRGGGAPPPRRGRSPATASSGASPGATSPAPTSPTSISAAIDLEGAMLEAPCSPGRTCAAPTSPAPCSPAPISRARTYAAPSSPGRTSGGAKLCDVKARGWISGCRAREGRSPGADFATLASPRPTCPRRPSRGPTSAGSSPRAPAP